MRALRSRWSRLTAPMPNNASERADLLELAVLLHNVESENLPVKGGANIRYAAYTTLRQLFVTQTVSRLQRQWPLAFSIPT